MCSFTRTFHPVGQGAFYSEKFEFAKRQKLIVYDCGSLDFQYLETELSSYFRKGTVIDIFFLSHFDEDHINGISKLKELGVKIKTVVIPLINEDDKWFYICTNGELVKEAINDPKSFFGADNIIQIKPVEEDHKNENREPITIDNPQIDQHISSGMPVSLSDISPFWAYIPFNFKEDERRQKLIEKLKNQEFITSEIKKKDCQIEKLLCDDDFIEKYHNKINKVYKEICTDGSNKCSLIVYSGAFAEIDSFHVRIKFSHQYNRCRCWYNRYNRYNRYSWHNHKGCLYLGDTDLNQGPKQDKILNQLKKSLGKYTDRIGIIQLPHHGAITNYNPSLLTINKCHLKLFFASYGTTNTYGHPSYNVIEQVINEDNYFCGVNEHRDSGLIEEIHIQPKDCIKQGLIHI